MVRRSGLVLLCAAAMGACVSLEEAPLPAGSIHKDQRTVVAVFVSPGPVMNESNSNADQLAKVIPGMSFLLAATQNQRDLEASSGLKNVLPPWRPEQAFFPILMRELGSVGYPGRFAAPAEAGFSAEALQDLNRAKDVIDWQGRYYLNTHDSAVSRPYASILPADDTLVLEVNLAYGAPSDGKGHWIPNLGAVMKLYAGGGRRLLWRHEEALSDAPGMRTVEQFRQEPQDLLAKYEKLMAPLAQALAAGLRKGLQDAVAPGSP